MGKKYRTRLFLKEGDSEALKELSKVYRKAYNQGIEVQFKHLSYSSDYSNQLIPVERVIDLIGNYEFSKNKVDSGIIEAGIRDSVEYFHDWWIKRLTTSSMNKSVPLTPGHLHSRNGTYFKTTTNLKVSSKDRVYIPKYGEIKIKRLHYIPAGTYKNAKVSFDGVVWDIYLESVIDETPIQIEFLRDSLEVLVFENGAVNVEDTTFTSPLEFDWFDKSTREISKANKAVKESKPNSREQSSARDKLSHVKSRLMRQTLAYYKLIANKILKSKPRKLTIVGEQLFEHTSKTVKESKVKMFLQVLKSKAERWGINVTVKGIDSSMFVIKK